MKKIRCSPSLGRYNSALFLFNRLIPRLEQNNGEVVSIFPATKDLPKLITLYILNSEVKITVFVTAVKTLRGRVLSMRGQR
jgi:hypothetical protein